MLLKKNNFLLLLALPFSLLSCNNKQKPTEIILSTTARKVTYSDFGNIDFNITQLEFEDKGFNYGDFIDVKINDWAQIDRSGSKDYEYRPGSFVTFTKVPLVTNYNEVGYFAPCLCNYQKANDRFDISFGINPFKNHAQELVNHNTTFTFTLAERGGYNNTLDLVRCTNKATFDEVGRDKLKFSNVRDVTLVGNIDEKIEPCRLIRGSSPFNPKKNSDNDGRHAIADSLLGYRFGANKEISLSYTETFNEEDGTYSLSHLMKELNRGNCLYTKNIYGFDEENQDDTKIGKYSCDNPDPTEPKKFLTVGLGSDYFYDTPNHKGKKLTKKVFSFLADAKAGDVFYIHCDEGKDRTGFFSMVIEALCGVSYKDIVADFMLTFNNYFGFNKRSDEGRIKHDTIKRITVCRHVLSICAENPANIEWEKIDAEQVLRSDYGISEENTASGALLAEAAKKYLIRLYQDDESGQSGAEIASKIINYFGLK